MRHLHPLYPDTFFRTTSCCVSPVPTNCWFWLSLSCHLYCGFLHSVLWFWTTRYMSQNSFAPHQDGLLHRQPHPSCSDIPFPVHPALSYWPQKKSHPGFDSPLEYTHPVLRTMFSAVPLPDTLDCCRQWQSTKYYRLKDSQPSIFYGEVSAW